MAFARFKIAESGLWEHRAEKLHTATVCACP